MNQQVSGPAPEEIKSLFNSIAHGYDKANDWMTGGMARGWRKQLVRLSGASRGMHVLDCATGTGDLAIEFAKAVGPSGKVIGSDFCEGMLEFAPAKAEAKSVTVNFEVADAMNLPYDDNSFDVVSIAYGIRNVANPKVALSEMARVCKPSGKVMVLETGDHQNPVIQKAFKWYFKNIVPRIGGFLTGQRDAYQYLQKSSSQFPSQQSFVDLMTSTGQFQSANFITLMGGASFIYTGQV